MSLSIYEALNIMLEHAKTPKTQIIPIELAISRICSSNLEASLQLPPNDISAMDGYAVKLQDAGREVEILKTVFAGDENFLQVENSKTIKIMTGATIPTGTQAVVAQENVQVFDQKKTILLPSFIKDYENIRKAGEDVKIGNAILKKGDKIDSFKIALLASQGVTHVEVYKKPKITVFASGNELKLHYEKLNQGQIHNSNTPLLLSRAKELGCEVYFVGKAQDSLESIEQTIQNSLDSDLIISTGGNSVGEADFTKEAFKNLGAVTFFEKIDIKPGKPTSFGKIGDSLVLNLPGNPLACALNFEIFAKPLIKKLSGSLGHHHSFILTKMKKSFTLKGSRDTVLPGNFDGEGFMVAQKFGPGMVDVLNRCEGFIIASSYADKIEQMQEIKFLPTSFEFLRTDFKDFISLSK